MRRSRCPAALLARTMLYVSVFVSFVPASQWALASATEATTWECEWWSKKLLLERHVKSVHDHLVQEENTLKLDYNALNKDVDSSGPAGRYPKVRSAHGSAIEKYWKAVWFFGVVIRSLSQVHTDMQRWQRHASSNSNTFTQCTQQSSTSNFNATRDLTVLVQELEKEANALFKLCEGHAHLCMNYRDEVAQKMKLLTQVSKEHVKVVEARKSIDSTKKALEEAKKENHIINEKVAIGCDMEKRLNIMKDTFLALETITGHVIVMGVGLKKLTGELREKANALGMGGIAVGDTHQAIEKAQIVKAKVSSALQSIFSAMYSRTSDSFHTLLDYGGALETDFSSCKFEAEVERAVLLRLVTDERRHHFDDFDVWRSSIATLWSSVSNMTLSNYANCDNFEKSKCETVMAKANSLMEASRKSRMDIETKLDAVIKDLLIIEGQVRKAMSVLAAERRRRDGGRATTGHHESTSSFEKHGSGSAHTKHRNQGDNIKEGVKDAASSQSIGAGSDGVGSSQGLLDSTESVLDVELDDADRKELENAIMGAGSEVEEDVEGLNLEPGSASGVRSGMKATTAVAVTASVVIALLVAGSLFMLWKRKRVVKQAECL
ncbi:hypothetical protein ERJ75_000485800 [Trypanosoma vivax]|nr:hypothetical protein ERJ75_000852300 [Trypanosoma vivax]KAH8616389.1 hypothetical protein ERJ75_000485800 [Trypanosoma vivax]